MQRMINAWETLAPTKSFGGMTLAQCKTAAQPAVDAREQIENLTDPNWGHQRPRGRRRSLRHEGATGGQRRPRRSHRRLRQRALRSHGLHKEERTPLRPDTQGFEVRTSEAIDTSVFELKPDYGESAAAGSAGILPATSVQRSKSLR